MIVAQRNNYSIATIERAGQIIYILFRNAADTSNYAETQSLASWGWTREGQVPSDAWARQQAFGALEDMG